MTVVVRDMVDVRKHLPLALVLALVEQVCVAGELARNEVSYCRDLFKFSA